MNPEILLKELENELKLLFADYKIKNKSGELVQPTVYRNDLPKQKGTNENSTLAPYQIVSLETGNLQDAYAPYRVKATIIFCVWNGFDDQNGDDDVLIQISTVVQRFMKDPVLGQFQFIYPIDWTTETQIDTYPYSIGGMELTFACPVKEREDLLT